MESPFAAVSPDTLMGIGIAGLAVFGSLVIGLASIFSQHQRKMAELIRRDFNPELQSTQVARLEGEVKELKDRVNQLILTIEDKNTIAQRLTPPEIPEHLNR